MTENTQNIKNVMEDIPYTVWSETFAFRNYITQSEYMKAYLSARQSGYVLPILREITKNINDL